MLKNSFAILVIGSLVTGSTFASPSFITKMFMQDKMMKSSSAVSNNNIQNPKFKFSGTWLGTCSTNGNTNSREIKITLIEDYDGLTFVDGVQDSVTYRFYTLKSESNSDKDMYHYNHTLLTRVNENTIRLEGAGVYGDQPPASTENDLPFTADVYHMAMTVNGNQLTVDMRETGFEQDKNESIEGKCNFKRIG